MALLELGWKSWVGRATCVGRVNADQASHSTSTFMFLLK